MDPFHPTYKQRRLPAFDYADTNHALFLTIRAKPHTSPFTNPPLASDVIASLHWLRTNRAVRIYAYCLMPDHLHLLLRLGGGGKTAGTIIGTFNPYTTRQSWEYGNRGALWQPRFYDHVLRKAEDGERIIVCILQNPVRKGVVEEGEDYPYCGRPDPLW